MDALLAHEKQPKADGAPGGGNESEEEDSDGWEEVCYRCRLLCHLFCSGYLTTRII